MRFAFVALQRAFDRVELLYRNALVSPSGFYVWLARGPGSKAVKDEALRATIQAVYDRSQRRHESPRAMHRLRHQGVRVSRKHIAGIMLKKNLRARVVKRFRTTTESSHGAANAPILHDRHFTAERPGVGIVGDTTAIATKEGWLYLAILVDLGTRAIVGWSVGAKNGTELVSKTFCHAMRKPYPKVFVCHRDRGSTYAAWEYRKLVEGAGGRRSMGRRSDCYDNALAESAFRTIKEETLGPRVLETMDDANGRLSFIEAFYNQERLPSTIGYRTPSEVENSNLSEMSKERQDSYITLSTQSGQFQLSDDLRAKHEPMYSLKSSTYGPVGTV